MTTKRMVFSIFFLITLCASTLGHAEAAKSRIFVVSSYHREYGWSQSTNKGLCAAWLKFGYLDNQQQADDYTQNDAVESSKAVIKKEWMDTKRKNSKEEVAATTVRIMHP